jgi:truncated hemoglobin YjbI
MISLKEGLIAIIAGLFGGVITYNVIPKAKPHYPLHSPENLARLARGRQIRHQQQRAMSANKRAEKREKLLEKLKRLA